VKQALKDANQKLELGFVDIDLEEAVRRGRDVGHRVDIERVLAHLNSQHYKS